MDASNSRRMPAWFYIALCMFVFVSEPSSAQTLRAIGGGEYPPLTYMSEGVLKGYEIDVMNELASVMHRTIRIELMPWNTAQQLVLAGDADMLTPMTITPERRKTWDFSEPTTRRIFHLFVRSTTIGVENLSDLNGKRVGVPQGSFQSEELGNHKNITRILVDGYSDGFQKLASGRIDAFAGDLWVASYILEKNRVQGIRVVPRPFAIMDAGIAVKKGNGKLLDAINTGIQELRRNGTIDRLRAKWAPEETVFLTQEHIDNLELLAVGSGVAGLVVLLLVWIFVLQYQIAKRRKTEQELRDEKQFSETILNLSPDMLYIYDLHQQLIVYSNGGIFRVLGYSNEEVVQMGPNFISGTMDSDDFRDYIEKILPRYEKATNGELIRHSYRMRSRSGDWHWIESQEVIYRRSPDGRPHQIFGAAQDITLRRTIDIELAEHRDHLERLVKERTQELSESLSLLKQSQEQIISNEKFAMLGQLVAGVAHEINTPIGVAVTASSFAELQLKSLLEEKIPYDELQARLQKIAEAEQLTMTNLYRASEIISSFKRLAVDQASDMQRTFSLNEVVTGTAQSLSPSLNPTPYSLEIECLSNIEMNSYPGAISQILTNLIINSITHGFDGRAWGTIHIRCFVEGPDNVIVHRDDGMGIPDELHDEIFKPFFTTKRGTGTGLGLSIVNNLVTQKLKGKLSFRNTEEGGAEFTIRIPRDA